ncbi:hypothetical protein [Undibacterium sp.]|uniref:hypothetical protein n=1 Tax=Undibacterium sp. TaxID=1914977 RepID=UPI0025E2A6C6|nr:hypothetical protein [Undibacterium sp.]
MKAAEIAAAQSARLIFGLIKVIDFTIDSPGIFMSFLVRTYPRKTAMYSLRIRQTGLSDLLELTQNRPSVFVTALS